MREDCGKVEMLLYLDKKKKRKWGKCWGLKRKLKQHKVCGRFFGKGLNYCPRYPKSDLPLVIFCACEKEKEEKKHSADWHVEGEAQQNTGPTGGTQRFLTEKMTFTNAPIRSRNLE